MNGFKTQGGLRNFSFMLRIFVHKVISSKGIQHLLFWGLSYWILLNIFAYDAVFYRIDFLFTALFHLSLVFIVYLNIRLLIPYYLERQAYFRYLLSGLAGLLIAGIIHEVAMGDLSKWFFPDYYFISEYGRVRVGLILLIYLAVSTLLRVSKSWFRLRKTEQQLEQLRQEALQRELDLLRGQVNPHFLFNSLNSIYALIIDQQSQSGDAVLKLAEVLRYALYQSSKEKVPLSDELQHLRQYVELEQLRAENADIRLEIKGEAATHDIAPLLLLPLVENGFKHGIKGDVEQLFLHIFIQISPHSLDCKVINNLGEVDPLLPQMEGGIGLKNLKRRLAISYPERHELTAREEGDRFMAHLKITIS